MSWYGAGTFAAWTPKAEQIVREASATYTLLRPPTTPILLLANYDLPTEGPLPLAEALRTWAGAAEVIDASRLQAVAGEMADVERYGFPEREALLAQKWFADVAETRVAIYVCETFGGRSNFEWAWLLGGGVETALLMLDHRLPRRDVLEVTATSTSMSEYRGISSIMGRVLRHLGVEGSNGYFKPFERGFDWSPYRVTVMR